MRMRGWRHVGLQRSGCIQRLHQLYLKLQTFSLALMDSAVRTIKTHYALFPLFPRLWSEYSFPLFPLTSLPFFENSLFWRRVTCLINNLRTKNSRFTQTNEAFVTTRFLKAFFPFWVVHFYCRVLVLLTGICAKTLDYFRVSVVVSMCCLQECWRMLYTHLCSCKTT